ncbi:MAG: hypothetical protein ABIM89_16665 [Mycobacteriales bacterium]
MRESFGTARATRALATAALIASAGCSAGSSGAASAAGAHSPNTPPATFAAASARPDESLPARPTLPTTGARTPLADLLVLRGPGGSTVVDSATGRTRTSAAGAIPAPDGATLIRAAGGTLSAVDSRDGSTRDLGTATPPLVPAVTTSDGRRVALAEPAAAPAADGYIAPGRQTSRIAVTGGSGSPTVFELAGNYQPEAFSIDGRLLFLIEYLPPAAPNRYRVRQLDLATGTVNGVLGPQKQLLEEEMRGIGRMQLLDERRSVLYTLYRTMGSDRAFVHTLHLDGLWAHCIVLPPEFGRGGADTAIAIGPTGTLYAWDGSHMSVVDAEQLSVRRTVPIGSGGPASSVAVAVGADGTVVTVTGATVTELRPSSLEAMPSWSLPDPAAQIALSADGKSLYAVNPTSPTSPTYIATLDRDSHATLGRFAVPDGNDWISAVLPKT